MQTHLSHYAAVPCTPLHKGERPFAPAVYFVFASFSAAKKQGHFRLAFIWLFFCFLRTVWLFLFRCLFIPSICIHIGNHPVSLLPLQMFPVSTATLLTHTALGRLPSNFPLLFGSKPAGAHTQGKHRAGICQFPHARSWHTATSHLLRA